MARFEVGKNDFRTYCIKNNLGHLLKEWHPTKNGNLKPSDVTAGSNTKVWWFLPYDDPGTGKHFDFEWRTSVRNRATGKGCPYISYGKLWAGFNDLATVRPGLAAEWHPTKNGSLKPSDVAVGSSKKVWWLLPYDDPKTGKHFDLEWQAKVGDRYRGTGCPYILKGKVLAGFNDLATTHPALAAEWHPTKNGGLKPTGVTAGSDRKVWWLLPYDDPKTGRHFDFEWETSVSNRVAGVGCPYISGRAVLEGYNDLATANPKLAAEWHPTKNGGLKPTGVTAGSNRKVWWLGGCGHEWRAAIDNRRHRGCPICAKEAHTSFPEQAIFYYVRQAFPDAENGNRSVLGGRELDIYIPSIKAAIEYDGMQWHQDAKKDGWKNRQCAKEGVVLYRVMERERPAWEETGFLKLILCEPEDLPSLEAAIRGLMESLGAPCPDVDIGRDRAGIYSQYIVTRKRMSLASQYPQLAKEWHPTKNGGLSPSEVSMHSNKKVWWLLPYDDPKTGKHFDFEWEESVNNRSNGRGCPYLSGKKVCAEFNSLAAVSPQLAKEWHPVKNGGLKPTDVSYGYGRRVWWFLPYDDPNTGRHFDFEWQDTIGHRLSGRNCPYLSGKKVWVGFNDLGTIHPELAKEWHLTKNGDLKPSDATAGSGKKVWWYLPYDDPNTGRHFDFEWQSTIYARANGEGCPYLSNKKVLPGFNDLATVRPDLLAQWHPTKNAGLDPSCVTVGSSRKVWWVDQKGEESYLSIANAAKRKIRSGDKQA